MNVLSLFDGISCGQLALQRANVRYENYYASEIDKSAIKICQANFPNTIQLGDVTKIDEKILKDLPKIDLLIGGSPCQGFSFSGKGLNFNDPRSKLFFDFVRILNIIKPKYFLLENVIMKKEYQDVISQYLGVEPVEINSCLVSAQNRRRLYWANFPISQPKDLNISLKDILEKNIPFQYNKKDLKNEEQVKILYSAAIRGRYIKQEIKNDELFKNNDLNKATIIGRRLNENGSREDYNKKIPISQILEVRATNLNKSNCLTTVDKDNVLTPLPVGRYKDVFINKLPFRYYTLTEQCRLQTVPENYFKGLVSDSKAKKMLGNGWTVDVIKHILLGIKEKY